MRILGVSEGSHDAAWCLIEDGEILEAHHVERHTQIKNDKWLKQELLPKADVIVGHEFKGNVDTRRKRAGQEPRKHNIKTDIEFNHHDTHAYAGWATSPFNDCDILVLDAIGESQCTVFYKMRNNEWEKTVIHEYPTSLGLGYSAVTAMLGFKPMEEEYIVMGLAAYGEPNINFDYLLETNCHRGIPSVQGKQEDIAASVQHWYERQLLTLVDKYCKHENLILMGGCALNCVANSLIKNKNIWIMPNPGDAGSSLGACAALYNKKLNWKGPYLGTDVQTEINPSEVVRHLNNVGMCGVVSGRAEFGPRALGNRSFIADPRLDIKDTINKIKRRQKFRPFAPAILEEHSQEFFEGPMNEYMQFVAKAKHDYESVTHVDGTARVQVVKSTCTSIIRPILEEWYEKTGCPMLLNTSLNIKGQPIVDNLEHARLFELVYQVKVF